MYKFVFDSCSVCWGVVLGPIVLFVFVLLKLVLNVPLCDPVFDELLEFVLLGEAAVGTRCPYCKGRRKERHISSTPRHNGDHSEIHQSSAFVIDSTRRGCVGVE